jgi:O6-methylguanine-DNA--protein-cysteine methyltransferase
LFYEFQVFVFARQLRFEQAIHRVPAGTTVSSAELARTIGEP